MKNELRRDMRKHLKNLTSGVYRHIGSPQQILPASTKTLFTYLPFDNEIDPTNLTSLALAQGLTVAAPRIYEDNLIFNQLFSTTEPFTIGPYGIREPGESAPQLFPSPKIFPSAQIYPAKDCHQQSENCSSLLPLVVLVPGLAFARDGSRLGRGKGYYDRFLSSLIATYAGMREKITLIGVCHNFQIVSSVFAESHDIPVDCLLTESGSILI